MPDETSDAMKKLANLSPEARKRVEASLARTIDAEISKEAALGGVPGTAKEFSKGVFFSRSRDNVASSRIEESRILDNAASMDDATFAKFAERLASLKSIKDR